MFQPTIRFLVQILEKSEIARNGNWSVGNCLLAVCYSVLLHHHSSATVTGEYLTRPQVPLRVLLNINEGREGVSVEAWGLSIIPSRLSLPPETERRIGTSQGEYVYI